MLGIVLVVGGGADASYLGTWTGPFYGVCNFIRVFVSTGSRFCMESGSTEFPSWNDFPGRRRQDLSDFNSAGVKSLF